MLIKLVPSAFPSKVALSSVQTTCEIYQGSWNHIISGWNKPLEGIWIKLLSKAKPKSLPQHLGGQLFKNPRAGGGGAVGEEVVNSGIGKKQHVLYFIKIILAFTGHLLCPRYRSMFHNPPNYSMRQELVTLQADWLQSLVLNITTQ